MTRVIRVALTKGDAMNELAIRCSRRRATSQLLHCSIHCPYHGHPYRTRRPGSLPDGRLYDHWTGSTLRLQVRSTAERTRISSWGRRLPPGGKALSLN